MKTTQTVGAPVASIKNLVKHFKRGDGTLAYAIDDVSFDIHPGEFVVLLGPSGCGKTTLLRAVAGLEEPDSGEISIHGNVCFSSDSGVHRNPEQRGISMIFQSYALWPHMTVADNIAYPLKNINPKVGTKLSKTEIATKVRDVLELVGIPELSGQYPSQISGGQQQRVALARALVGGSDLILFDEPLSNVDAKVREQLRYELVEMQEKIGFSALYVTHDQEEAMSMADRIAVLGNGKIIQLDEPRDIYFKPVTRYVANFVGKSNEIQGKVTAVDEATASVRLDTAAGNFTAALPEDGVEVGDQVTLNWRPETAILSERNPSEAENTFEGKFVSSVFLGAVEEWRAELNGSDTVITFISDSRNTLQSDKPVWFTIPKNLIRLLKK